MRNFNLIINYYSDKSKERQEEIDTCLNANLLNAEINKVIVVVNKKDTPALKKMIKGRTKKVKVVPMEKRPSYHDFFQLTKDFPDDINALANADIIMNEPSTKQLREYDWQSNYCFALSRWDLKKNEAGEVNFTDATLWDHADSQDTWIFLGTISGVQCDDVTLGVAGCDNVIADRIKENYLVFNPSRNIVTFHYHISDVRNYNAEIERLPPPYHLIHPHYIEQVKDMADTAFKASQNQLPTYSDAILGVIRGHFRTMTGAEVVELMQRGTYPFSYAIHANPNNASQIFIELATEKYTGRIPNNPDDFITIA